MGVPVFQRGKSRSLFFSTKVASLRQLHPEVEVLHRLSEEARFVVSEPLRDLPGAWNEVPESSAGVVRPGQDEIRASVLSSDSLSTAARRAFGWPAQAGLGFSVVGCPMRFRSPHLQPGVHRGESRAVGDVRPSRDRTAVDECGS